MGVRVVVAEDVLIVREGILRMLDHQGDIDVVGVCEDLPGLLAAVDEHRPTWCSPTSGCRRPAPTRASGPPPTLREPHPDIGVVVLSPVRRRRLGAALLDGGSEGRAYLLKERVCDVDAARRGDPRGRRAAARSSTRRSSRSLVAARQPRNESPLDRLTRGSGRCSAEMAQGKNNAAIAAVARPQPSGRSRSTSTRCSPSSACPRRPTSTAGSRPCCCTWPTRAEGASTPAGPLAATLGRRERAGRDHGDR